MQRCFDDPPAFDHAQGMGALDLPTRRSIDPFVVEARTRYPAVEARLCGSRAQGTAREDSDVDLALVIDGDMRSTSSVVADMGNESYDVLDLTGLYVSPLRQD